MARKKKSVKPRRQYRSVTKADRIREVLAGLTVEELEDVKTVFSKTRHIKVARTSIYAERSKELSKSGEGMGKGSEDLLAQLLAVKKLETTVGGLAKLKSLISILERIR